MSDATGTGANNTSFVEAKVPAFVKALTTEELIAGITQQNLIITLSPTHLADQQWPGGRTIATTATLIPPLDPGLPIQNDKVIVRGRIRNVERVIPVFDGGDCIRIELAVLG